jgi:hypothetical protein
VTATGGLCLVRDGLTSYDDPGWYKHPPETLARKVAPR